MGKITQNGRMFGHSSNGFTKRQVTRPQPNPHGNRAERRAAAKQAGKKPCSLRSWLADR
jgi:hypothetical protein